MCKAGVGGCSVEACREDDIPTGIKGSVEKHIDVFSRHHRNHARSYSSNDYGVYELLSIRYSILSNKC